MTEGARPPGFLLALLGIPLPPPDPDALRSERVPGRRGCVAVTGPEAKVREHADLHREEQSPLELRKVVEEPHEIEPGVWRAVTVFYWQDN